MTAVELQNLLKFHWFECEWINKTHKTSRKSGFDFSRARIFTLSSSMAVLCCGVKLVIWNSVAAVVYKDRTNIGAKTLAFWLILCVLHWGVRRLTIFWNFGPEMTTALHNFDSCFYVSLNQTNKCYNYLLCDNYCLFALNIFLIESQPKGIACIMDIRREVKLAFLYVWRQILAFCSLRP